MLEESWGEGKSSPSSMDKKSRQSSVPPPSKASASKKENGNKGRYRKKDYGGGGANGNGRGGSRGDGGGYSQQKGSTPRGRYDKRPRARGDYASSQREEMMGGDERAEYGSAQSWGSKKSNLNHLLNFHFVRNPEGASRGGNGGGGRSGRGKRTRSGFYNKERFLQANCQFIVTATGDYDAHILEPDSLVDWDRIEQVRLYTHEEVKCPICLYPPTAAKITRCGHIYCWTCMLHYLSLDDRTWRKCPICYESVSGQDMKSVQPIVAKQYKVGDQITLQLMKKPKGSTRVFPVADWVTDIDFTKPGVLDDSPMSKYAKLLLATPQQVIDIVRSERTALETLKAEQDTDNLECSFIQAAMNDVDERLLTLSRACNVEEEVTGLMNKLTTAENPEPEVLNPLKRCEKDVVAYADAFDDKFLPMSAVEPTPLAEIEDVEEVKGRSESESSDPDALCESSEPDQVKGAEAAVKTEAYYFYQSVDGQHVYIHAVNARCLIKEYGSLEQSPPLITASIVELEPVTMDEDLRYRLRYLSHLPLSCEFIVAEVALKPPILSKETAEFFADDLQRRHKQRQRKQRDERRRDRRIQEDENRLYGIDRNTVIVRSQSMATQIQRPVEETVIVESAGSAGSTPVGSPQDDIPVGSPQSQDDGGVTSSALSFAQMLKQGKAKQPEPSPVVPKTRVRASDSEGDPVEMEGYVPTPQYKASFSDAIQMALDNFENKESSKPVAVNAPMATGGGKKKKKATKQLLFSTSMNYGK